MKKIFHTEQELIDFSIKFFNPLPKGKIFLLNGDLGVGKTTFLRGLAFNLGLDFLPSPTYTIFNKYEFSNFNFYHLDLYRLSSAEEFEIIGGKDIISDDNSIIAIEWPQIVFDIMPKDRLVILNFSISDDSRIIDFEHSCN